MIKDYLIEIFEPSLLFGLLCALVGLSAAIYLDFTAGVVLGIVAIIGIVIAQIAVNLIDDYVDYKIGIDKETIKTKFSGGSSLVVDKKVSTNGILIIAIIALLISGVLGFYLLQFLNIGVLYLVLILIVFGGISVIFYAKYFTHVPFFSEPFVTICFAVIGIGVYLVASNSLTNVLWVFLLVCIPSGLQVGVAMIANELPDRKADKKYGRRNIVIMLSSQKNYSGLYFIFQAIGYLLLGYGMVERFLPITFLILFALIPGMYLVGRGIENYKDPKTHEKVMGLNSIMAFLYIFLLSFAFLIVRVV